MLSVKFKVVSNKNKKIVSFMIRRIIKRVFVIAAFAAILIAAQNSYARDVRFEVNADKLLVAIGESVQVGLTFYEERSVPVPDIAKIDGFDVRYVGPSTMMTVINGKMSSSITYLYAFTPLKTGKFTIGPFMFDGGGNKYTSNSVGVEVVEERAQASPQSSEREPIIDRMDLADRIFLTVRASKADAFVNELVPVTVKLYVNSLNVSDIQLPTFGQEGFSKADFKEPKQYRERSGGVVYDVLEFNTTIFGTRPGEFKLGPAKIKCNIMVKKSASPRGWNRNNMFEDDFFDDFLTRHERHPVELESDSAPLVISALPQEGRPRGFSGAVGDYQFIFNASPTKLKVGDPVTLNMEINGNGNFNTVLVPEFDNTDGFRVYDPEIKTGENGKSFKVVLIPESDKVNATPTAVFSFFDPNRKQYRTISQGSIPISVEKGKDEAPAQVVGAETETRMRDPVSEDLKRDIIYIKESPGTLVRKGRNIFQNHLFAAFLPLPIVFLVAFSIMEGKRARFRTDSAYAGRLIAIKSSKMGIKRLKDDLRVGDVKRYYETLFKTLQDYLGNRLNIPTAGITSDIVDSVLVPKGVDTDIVRRIRELFEVCDRSRFAFTEEVAMKMDSDMREIQEIIKYFERTKI